MLGSLTAFSKTGPTGQAAFLHAGGAEGEGRSAPRMIQAGIQRDAHRGGRTEFGRRREASIPDRSRGSPRRSTPEGRWREIPARFARIPGTFGAGRFWF